MIKIVHFIDPHIFCATYGKTFPETGLPVRVFDFLMAPGIIVNPGKNS